MLYAHLEHLTKGWRVVHAVYIFACKLYLSAKFYCIVSRIQGNATQYLGLFRQLLRRGPTNTGTSQTSHMQCNVPSLKLSILQLTGDQSIPAVIQSKTTPCAAVPKFCSCALHQHNTRCSPLVTHPLQCVEYSMNLHMSSTSLGDFVSHTVTNGFNQGNNYNLATDIDYLAV